MSETEVTKFSIDTVTLARWHEYARAASRPMVVFTGDMEAMRKQADETARENLEKLIGEILSILQYRG